MSKSEIITIATSGMIGGTLGYVTEQFWTAILVTIVLTVIIHTIAGSAEKK